MIVVKRKNQANDECDYILCPPLVQIPHAIHHGIEPHPRIAAWMAYLGILSGTDTHHFDLF